MNWVERLMQSTNMNLNCSLALFLLALLVPCDLFADHQTLSLRPNVPLADQLHNEFSLRDGLSSNWINDVIQTRDGYLWIATDNGLVRFDGLHFKLFGTSVPQLPCQEIRVLYEDHAGYLWIGTTAGLTRYKPGRPGIFDEIPNLLGSTIFAIYEDSQQTLWIGTKEETWTKRNNALEFEIVRGAPTNVRAICEDACGTRWFGSHFGLFRQQGSIYQQLNHERLPTHSSTDSSVPESRVNAILADVDGGLWIGANRALLHMRNGQFTARGRELGSQQIYEILRTGNGGLIVAARFGLYRSVGEGPFERLSSLESALCLLEDRDGALWVGHGNNRGLHCYRNNPAQTFWNQSVARCIHKDASGGIWFGSDSGLHCMRDGQVTDFGVDDGLPDLSVQTIARGSGSTLWIGTNRGLVRWTGQTLETDTTTRQLAKLNIAVAFEDSSGLLWLSLATSGGFIMEKGELRELPVFQNGRIHWFHEAPDGVLWIGHESGLFQYRDGRFRQVKDPAFDRLYNPRFLCHAVSQDGSLWMGTSNGIVRHQAGRFESFSANCGLQADNIERMIEDHHGFLWFGGRDGLFRADTLELDAFACGRLPQFHSQRIAGFDRFPPLPSFSQACLVHDDDLWIVAEHGLVRIPTKPFLKQLPPPQVQIDNVLVDNLAVNFEEQPEFLAGRRRLSFQFSVPEFLNPRQIQVRYRLDNFDEDWHQADKSRTLHFTDLQPGNYALRLSARNGNGAWAEASPSVSVTVRPRWWERMSVRSMAAFSLVALSVLSARRYNHAVRKRNISLSREINERKRALMQLQNSEERFRSLAKSTLTIPWEADAATLKFTFVGKQALDVLGYPAEKWLEENFWLDHLHAEDRSQAVESRQQAIRRGGSFQMEYRMVHASGASVWFQEVLHLAIKDGKAERLAGFLIDVTARHNAEERAREYLRQLARIDRAASMGEMATSIAHEVKQPLFAIVSNAASAKRLLEREPPDMQEVRESLADIIDDGKRASNIIDQIRSRVSRETQPTQSLDLNRLVLEVVEFASMEIRHWRGSLRMELADQLPRILGNPTELQQVILNLIINAVQAIQETELTSPAILVKTMALGDFVQLDVHDCGVGLDQSTAARLFEPFFTTKPQGTGMGLAISRTIIEAHNGRIWATSNDDHGATFHFCLPIMKSGSS